MSVPSFAVDFACYFVAHGVSVKSAVPVSFGLVLGGHELVMESEAQIPIVAELVL
ncbi:hypothetical protein [Pseudarthrobacter sp. CCNWLW207]|uniref:hypothetical protein n=1 Tax=Pseudarthrobacter sp. CCNWLW207 TaxID=3127468 RepID=UPI0030782758